MPHKPDSVYLADQAGLSSYSSDARMLFTDSGMRRTFAVMSPVAAGGIPNVSPMFHGSAER